MNKLVNSRTPNYLVILIPNCKHVANIRNYHVYFLIVEQVALRIDLF